MFGTKLIKRSLSTCNFDIFGDLKNSYVVQRIAGTADMLGLNGYVEFLNEHNAHGLLQGNVANFKMYQKWLKSIPINRGNISEVRIYNCIHGFKDSVYRGFVIRSKAGYVDFGKKDLKDANNFMLFDR